jgi:hypothetical protein
MPDGQGGARDFPQQAVHELVISGDNLAVFADRVGFEDDAKSARLAAGLAGYRRQLNRERFTARVQALTPDGVEPVFDVTVEHIHAFDANGLMVHNCAEQPLPPYGCCCLGSIDLTRFVRGPSRPTRPSTRPVSWRCRRWRCACWTTCSTSRSGRCRSSRRSAQQAPHRPGLHRAGRRAGDAGPALRHRRRTRDGARISEVHARRGLRGVGRTGARARRLPAVQRRPVPQRQHLCHAPAAGAARPHPPHGPAQFAPAVDRAHRHHQPGLRRQRQQRHRAGLQLDLHPQEAHARRQPARIRGRRTTPGACTATCTAPTRR